MVFIGLKPLPLRYLGWSRGAGFVKKNKTFALFSQSILVTTIELGRDIARRKGHLVCEFDFK